MQVAAELTHRLLGDEVRDCEDVKPLVRSTVSLLIGPITIVLINKTGPRGISIRCKISVSLAREAVHVSAEENADPVFVINSKYTSSLAGSEYVRICD